MWRLRVLPVPAWVPGTPSFLPRPKGMHVGLIGNSELSVGVNVSLNYCLSLCVSPVIDWQPI